MKLIHNISKIVFWIVALTPMIYGFLEYGLLSSIELEMKEYNDPSMLRVWGTLWFVLFVASGLLLIGLDLIRFERIGKSQSILELWPDVAIENNIYYNVIDKKNANKIQKQILPINKPTVTDKYFDLVAHGYSAADIQSKAENISGSLDMQIAGIYNPTINGNQKKGLIRVEYSKNGLPKVVKYRDAPKRKGFIVLGKSIKGWEYIKISELYHFLVYAMTRNGKSVMIGNILAQLFLPNEGETALIIDFKAGATAMQYEQCFNISIVTNIGDPYNKKSYETTIRALSAVILIMNQRQSKFARAAANEKSVNFPHLWIVLEEAAEFFDGSKAAKECAKMFGSIGKMGAGVNVHLIVGTQRPTLVNLPEMVRTNIESVIAGRTGDENTAGLLNLPEAFMLPKIKGRMIYKDESNEKIFFQSLFVDMRKGEGGRIIKNYGARETTNAYKIIQGAIDGI